MARVAMQIRLLRVGVDDAKYHDWASPTHASFCWSAPEVQLVLPYAEYIRTLAEVGVQTTPTATIEFFVRRRG